MSRQQSYGGFGENLVTAGGDRALVIEVSSPLAQRVVSCTASCIAGPSAPTAGMLAGFARLLVYIGTIPDLASFSLDASNFNPLSTFGLSRVLASILVPMGKPVQWIVPQVQSDRLHAQPGETLGAAIILPVTMDTASNNVAFNAFASLDFYGTAIEEDTHKYKAV